MIALQPIVAITLFFMPFQESHFDRIETQVASLEVRWLLFSVIGMASLAWFGLNVDRFFRSPKTLDDQDRSKYLSATEYNVAVYRATAFQMIGLVGFVGGYANELPYFSIPFCLVAALLLFRHLPAGKNK
jgi:hypothetical protein